MWNEFIIVALFFLICAFIYILFLTSLTWVVDMRKSLLLNSKRSKIKGAVICRTCGTNFIEDCYVEDGKCQICGRSLCSRCGLECICPLCLKIRTRKKENFSSMENQEKLAAHNIINFFEMKVYSDNKQSCDKNYLIDFIQSKHKKINHRGKKKSFSEYGVEYSYDSFVENQQTELISKSEHWKQNWLFKKKRTFENSRPLAMFLPAPCQTHKAQVGGINVDDLSDLSDSSDLEIDLCYT